MTKQRIRGICLWVLAAGIGMTERSVAQHPNDDVRSARLDAVSSSYTPKNAFMGTVLVVQGDKILLDKGYGQADLEWNIPDAPDVKFRLGSLTKQFTAALILLLQEDGKLNIADPVSRYLPNTPPAWEKITLAELLGHTSGIPSFTADKDFGTWRMNPHTHEEEVAFFKDKPLDFAPGTKFAYSNSNFEVLGTLIEKVSGKSYGELLQERIFGPLGMKDTGLDNDELILPKRAQGYAPGPHGLILARSESMSVPWAAGSLYSTTGDLLRWEHALFGLKVLNAASLKQMTTPGLGGYALGLFVRTEDGVTVVEHGGGIEGFNTSLAHVPERDITVVVLSNVNGSAPDEMGNKLLDVALGKQVTLPTERVALPVPKDDLAKYPGVYRLAPAFALTVAIAGDGLTIQGTGQPASPVFYEGLKDGHPRFFSKVVDAEIEFVPDGKGSYTSLILHQGGHDMPAPRQ